MQIRNRADKPNLENIFNAMPDGIVIINQQCEIHFLNKTLEDEFGIYSGQKCFEYFQGEESPCAWCRRREVFSGETIRSQWYCKKNGKTYNLIDAPFQSSDNSISKLTILRDDTERKLAEERLHTQAQRISVFFNSLNDAILVHPLKEEGFAPFVEVNDIACKRYGYSYEEFLQLSATDISQKSDSDIHRRRSQRRKLLQTKQMVFEAVHIKKSGEKIPVEINSNIIYESGKPFILSVVRDITERKRMEFHLRKIQQLEAVATLSGGIAHEFNNALNIISGNIELLQMALPGNEKVGSFEQQAMASIRRMSKLTSQLHAYARGGRYKAKSLNLSTLVKNALPNISPGLCSDIEIDTDLSENISCIMADSGQLQMVLSAVLSNAAEAMEGPGNIHIRTREEEVDEVLSASHPGITPGRYVALTIRDNGRGMAQEINNRIFDPFFTTKFQGRGLGMAAVYGIVKNHDGCIYVDSELKNGTSVNIYFPCENENE